MDAVIKNCQPPFTVILECSPSLPQKNPPIEQVTWMIDAFQGIINNDTSCKPIPLTLFSRFFFQHKFKPSGVQIRSRPALFLIV
jgi:hypothetical protein